MIGPRRRACVLGLRCPLVEVVAAAGSFAPRAATEISAAFAASAEKDQVAGHHFRHVFLLSAGLVVPGASLQVAFDADFAALLQILSGNFGKPLPSTTLCHSVRSCHSPALSLKRSLGRRRAGHGRALRCVFNFWIFAKIADQLNSIETFACHWALLCGVHYSRIAGVEWCQRSQSYGAVSFWCAPYWRSDVSC